MEHKKCKMCQKRLPIESFYLLRKDGKYRQSYCKTCSVERAKPHRKKYNINQYTQPKHRARRLYESAKNRAKKKRLPFTLTRKRVDSAIEKGVCEVTGIKFDMAVGKGRQPFSPSIDRMDLDKGYTDDNVKVVIWMHNMVRSNWGNEPLKLYLKSFLTKAKDVR